MTGGLDIDDMSLLLTQGLTQLLDRAEENFICVARFILLAFLSLFEFDPSEWISCQIVSTSLPAQPFHAP